MKDKMIDMEVLSEYLNRSRFNSTDDEIALYLYEHRDEISKKSLKELAEKSYISQPSFTRFFKKYGVEKYQNFRYHMARHESYMEAYMKELKHSFTGETIDQIKQDIIEKQIANIIDLKNIDNKRLQELVKTVSNFQRVIFIGSDLSMSLLRSLQAVLMGHHVHCYTLKDPSGQEYMLERSGSRDLVIFVSIKGRWIKGVYSQSTIEKLKQSPAYKMLWTLEQPHQYKELFNEIFFFGKYVNNLGYTQLTNFVFLFIQAYFQYCNE